MSGLDFDAFVAAYHEALDAFFRGDPRPAQALYSHDPAATLANPFGPVRTGWEEISEAMDRAAAHYTDGSATGFATFARAVPDELAYMVEVERFRAKIGGATNFSEGALRVTSIVRPEDGGWRILHRHADPITSERPAQSVGPPV